MTQTPPHLAREIFKANDIRGIYGATLFDQTARDIGAAFAAAAQGVQQVAVARDTRLSGDSLSAALIGGLTAGGIRVLDIGMAPTPALYFAAVTRADGNGIMVTGSHNPKEHNGMKMMMAGKTLKGNGIQNLYNRISGSGGQRVSTTGAARVNESAPVSDCAGHRVSSTAGAGDRGLAADGNASGNGDERVMHLSVMDDFVAAVAAANPCARRLKVVVDAGNGATCRFAPALFAAMGHDVIPLFCEPDGNFPNHHPDPAQLKNLESARAAMDKSGADLALVFDGDGDRLGAILPGQETIFADRLLMLFARDLLARQPGARVVFDVKCSAHLAPWIERHGGVADMQPTGHAFIKAQMQKTGAQLGGEMSGHFYFRENWHGFDDALFAAARLAAILAGAGGVAAMMAGVPDSVASPELHVDMSGGDQHAFMRHLAQSADLSQFPGARRIVSIDGLRVEYDGGFGLVRASNTTAALVLRFEASTQESLAQIQRAFRALLTTKNLPATSLPF